MVRPFPFLATLLMLLALSFLIIAASTAHWLVSYAANVQAYEGVYNACWRQHDAAIDECRHVNNDCTADFSPPVGSFTLTDSCGELRAVRAFVVLAIIFAGLSFLALYLLSFTKASPMSTQEEQRTPLLVRPVLIPACRCFCGWFAVVQLPYLSLRPVSLALSFVTGLCGLIAWAIFIALSRNKTGYSDTTFITDYQYGFSFALLTASWPLAWLSLLLASIPWPYHPTAYDRARYSQQPSAAEPFEEGEEAQAAQRQRALRAGGVGGRPALSDRIWSAFGVSPEKRKGYAERWGGEQGGGYEAAQGRRQGGSRPDESLEEGRRMRGAESEGRGEERQSVFGALTGHSSGGGGATSSVAGAPVRPPIASAGGSEQGAESVPVVKMHI